MPRRKQKPAEVFLSHSHTDKALAVRIAKVLRAHGIDVWYSERNIRGAQQWMDEIGTALKRCDWFIVLLTPDAVKSKWVKREVTAALIADRYDERIVPLLAKNCAYEKLAWPLAGLQIVAVRPFDAGLAELLRIWGVRYRP